MKDHLVIDGLKYRKLNKNDKIDENIAKQIEEHLAEQSKERENDLIKEFSNQVDKLKADKKTYYLTRVVILRYLAFIYCMKRNYKIYFIVFNSKY